MLAMGLSSLDHTLVLDYYFKELKIIWAGVSQYDGIKGCMMNSSFDLLAYAADRKERNNVVRMLAMGTFAVKFGWLGFSDKN